jgi:hypothetical protein
MATQPAQNLGSNATEMLRALAQAEGSAGHVYPHHIALTQGRLASRNLADVAHHICALHGRMPGVVDHAASHTVHEAARAWLITATDGFAAERLYLTKLVVAAGPLPSTPGQAESESAVISQRHALEMLAQSDRTGCAIGAATALVLDWHALRPVLDKAAHRFGVDPLACTLPSIEDTVAVVKAISETPAIERALVFGAQQLLGQHHGLWDLLEARQIARGEH